MKDTNLESTRQRRYYQVKSEVTEVTALHDDNREQCPPLVGASGFRTLTTYKFNSKLPGGRLRQNLH